MEIDARRFALIVARVRAGIGLALVVAPGVVGRAWLGPAASGPEARALTRMLGARDVLMGIGAMIAVKEGGHGPEWMGMGALADAADAAVCLRAPGIPARGRLVGLLAGAGAVLGMKAARDLADTRAAPSA